MSAPRSAAAFWGGPLPALLAEAKPGSPLFQHLMQSKAFGDPDGLRPRYCGADFAAVRRELGLDLRQAAACLDVPLAYLRGLEAGWRQPSTAQLLWCAARYGVPFAAFFQDEAGRQRPHTRAFRSFLRADQQVLHL